VPTPVKRSWLLVTLHLAGLLGAIERVTGSLDDETGRFVSVKGFVLKTTGFESVGKVIVCSALLITNEEVFVTPL
jgi:hypothetical protein